MDFKILLEEQSNKKYWMKEKYTSWRGTGFLGAYSLFYLIPESNSFPGSEHRLSLLLSHLIAHLSHLFPPSPGPYNFISYSTLQPPDWSSFHSLSMSTYLLKSAHCCWMRPLKTQRSLFRGLPQCPRVIGVRKPGV
jgi:polyferredoxin